MSDSHFLRGLGVALVTPFHEDGSIDFRALEKLVMHQARGGTDFLVVLGTTGETPTLDENEQRQVVDFIIEVSRGQLPIVVGVTGNATRALCDRISSWNVEGISAFLVASPAYNKPSQAGIVQHFTEVANFAKLPVILYNVPGRTASNMEAATTLALAQHPNVCGIKEASGNLIQIEQIIAERPKGFLVWSGDDALAMPTVAMGAEGVISVLGNAFPQELGAMIQQAAFGQVHEARETHKMFANVISLLFEEGNPVGIKSALSHLGLCQPTVRLPLVEASKPLSDQLYSALATMDVQTTR